MKYKFFILIFFSNFLFNQTQESIYDRINLANSYAESGLEQDAIAIYKNVLSLQKDILGNGDIELIKILFELSDLYLSQNNIDSSKIGVLIS